MAHPQQNTFCNSVKSKYINHFQNKTVVDVGSLDINGSNKPLFQNCEYIGVDIADGKNVDVVSKGHELQYSDCSIDTIISSECFEHDKFYHLTIQNIHRMLKPGGMFIFTCATTGRREHGTRRTTPCDAPFLQDMGEWGDYYKNLTENDIKEIFDDFDEEFYEYEFSTNPITHDLYFYGFKKDKETK